MAETKKPLKTVALYVIQNRIGLRLSIKAIPKFRDRKIKDWLTPIHQSSALKKEKEKKILK